MIPKPLYKQLLKRVREDLEEQRGKPFIAISKGFYSQTAFTINNEKKYIRTHELKEVWPSIMKALGLVDDGTGYDTWTLPGRGITADLIFK